MHMGMSLDGRAMRVRFVPTGDRLRHLVEVLDGDRICTLIESIEGDSEERWPASPPLQDGDIASRDDWTRMVLLVGMAGSSHWSMSVELTPAGDQLTFDVACRHAEQPAQLLNSYRVGDYVNARTGAEGLVLVVGEQSFALTAEAIDGQSARIACQESRLTVHPPRDETAAAATVQWRYRLTRHVPEDETSA